MDNQKTIEIVKRWVETVVIGLNLCPFAKKVHLRKGIHYAVSEATTKETLLIHLHDALARIAKDPTIDTTLLIHPLVLNDFYDYNDFLAYADDLLDQMNLNGVYQIASFHPKYQFADTQPDDVENYTNRSPYPILHIISEEEITQAVASHPNIDSVPIRNKALMRDLGPDKMGSLLKACFS